jgi:hypothetical protein
MGERPDAPGEWIFVGTVESVGPAPPRWSGPIASYQEVRYLVDETIRGDAMGGRLAVLHAVVRDSPTAEPGDVPGLSSQLFGSGARLVVMAVHDACGPWFAPSEYFGALPYSRLLVEQFREATKGPGSSVTQP